MRQRHVSRDPHPRPHSLRVIGRETVRGPHVDPASMPHGRRHALAALLAVKAGAGARLRHHPTADAPRRRCTSGMPLSPGPHPSPSRSMAFGAVTIEFGAGTWKRWWPRAP